MNLARKTLRTILNTRNSADFHVNFRSHTSKAAVQGSLKVTYLTPEKESIVCHVKEGVNLLDVAHAFDIELEGACEGSLACSTCHLIVRDQDYYDKLDEPSDEENDMLDLAFGLTETSRLGCQVIMTKDLDNLVVQIPAATRNLQLKDS